MKPSLSTWSVAMIVVSIAAMGGAVRYMIAAEELLWLDELHTSWTVCGKFSEVAGRAADGNQSPFFFWLAWVPVQVFGESEFSVRTVSWVAGFGAMLVSALLVWRWTCSAIAASVTLALMAIDVQFIFYATEARPYALLQMTSVIQVALFWHLVNQTLTDGVSGQNRERHLFAPGWALSASSAVLVYIHYTALWIFVVELSFLPLLFVVTRRSGQRSGNPRIGKLLGRLFSTALISVLACIPAVVQMFSVFQRRGNWDSVSSPASVLRDLSATSINSIVIPLACLAVFLGVQFWFRRHALEASGKDLVSNQTAENPATALQPAFVLIWGIVPAACVVFLALADVAPVAMTRYTLVGSAAFPIFTGLVVARVSASSKRMAMALLIIGVTAWQNPIIHAGLKNRELPLLRTENWKSPIEAINLEESKKTHPLFLFSNLIEDVDAIENQDPQFQQYLLFPVRGLYEIDTAERDLIPRPTMPLEHFQENDIATIHQRGGAWVIVRGPPPLRDEIANELMQRVSDRLGKNAGTIQSNLLESPGSRIYLFTIDW